MVAIGSDRGWGKGSTGDAAWSNPEAERARETRILPSCQCWEKGEGMVHWTHFDTFSRIGKLAHRTCLLGGESYGRLFWLCSE